MAAMCAKAKCLESFKPKMMRFSQPNARHLIYSCRFKVAYYNRSLFTITSLALSL